MAYPRCPVDEGGITTVFSDIHQGIDIGWHAIKYAPVYAAYDCTVIEVGKTIKGGLYVKTRWADGHTDKSEHLKSICVKKGQRVTLGQQIGVRGASGTAATGVHLDYRVYTASGKAIDPQTVLYLYPGQVITKDKNMTMKTKPDYVLAPTVERNTAVHQCQVVKAKLRERTGADTSADVIDFATLGIYNVLEQQQADGHIWNRIGDYQWIAAVDGFVVDMPVATVDALQARIRALEAQISQDDQSIAALRKQADELQAQATVQADKITKAKEALN